MKIAVIHTTEVTYQPINQLIRELIADVEVMNLVDDSLLNDVKRHGGLTKEVSARLLSYALTAQAWGARVVLNACSSVGEAVDHIRPFLEIPMLKIDQPMAELAVGMGKKIAVFGTVKTTLDPSSRLIRSVAERMGQNVSVNSFLAEEAFTALTIEHNVEKHNAILKDVITSVAGEFDVLVLAQASMAVLIPELVSLGKPVLSSMRSGVAQLAEV